jgi:hypothetical protein
VLMASSSGWAWTVIRVNLLFCIYRSLRQSQVL